MTNALLRAPQSFSTAFAVVRDRPFSCYLGQLKMTFVPKHNGRRLSASYNRGSRMITFPVKAEHNGGNSFDDDEDSHIISYNGGNRLDGDEEPPLCRSSINIWWDFGRCPLPLNFDASKIGNTVIDCVRRINGRGAIFFRGYGDVGQLLTKMAEETLGIMLESGFQVIGFQMIDDFGSHVWDENLMMADLLYSVRRCPPPAIHMVVLDRESSTAAALDRLRAEGHEIIGLQPEQEATEGVWRWEPLSARVTSLP